MHMLNAFIECNPNVAELIKELTERSACTTLHSLFHDMSEPLADIQCKYTDFTERMSTADPNWKFWSDYISSNAFCYIALFVSIRSTNWLLRIAAIKLMAPIFSAFDRPTYRKLIPQHLADCLLLPSEVQEHFSCGGFTVSIKGRPWHSIGLDEAHEMLVNRDCKAALVHPNKEFISRMALYFPYRAKAIKNFKNQSKPHDYDDSFHTTKNTKKSGENIQAMKELLSESDTLPKQLSGLKVLRNGFTDTNATSAQQLDLLNFRTIGQTDFDSYVEHVYLRTGNPKASVKLHRLKTFTTSSKNVTKHQFAKLQAEKTHVTQCLKKRLLHCESTKAHNIPHEQYLELPRAIADINGIPQKGQKSVTTTFFQKKYGEKVFLDKFPPGWKPQSAILEGMFLINTTPLKIHSSMLEYTTFIFVRHAGKYITAGVNEVHIVFDDPGRFDFHPKDIERTRRESTNNSGVHEHVHIDDQTKIPSKWRELLGCRTCKRLLVEYVGECILRIAPKYLQNDQKVIVGGACEAPDRDHAWSITNRGIERLEPSYFSNAEEADTRVWLHAKHSRGERKLIFSPDTDVYHIGLTYTHCTEHDVLVQLSMAGSALKLLQLNNLKDALCADPELHSIPVDKRCEILQVLYVSTGCDFTSYFAGIGKTTFLKTFYRYSQFITTPGQHNVGSLADVSPQSNGFLAFSRLVGTTYFSKHLPAFQSDTPISLFHSCYSPDTNAEEHHMQWYGNIRDKVWERITFEEQLPPSWDALKLHWLRSIWVIDYWRQSDLNIITLLPLEWFGWVTQDSKVQVDWDSCENLQKTRDSVAFLTQGCGCKTGCGTARCKCVKMGRLCGPGCTCSRAAECQNTSQTNKG